MQPIEWTLLSNVVMPGLRPGHPRPCFSQARKTWMAGAKPGHDEEYCYSVESKSSSVALRMPASSRTAFGAWPGLAAKVVDGVSAISRLAAAATRLCERQCAGSVSHR